MTRVVVNKALLEQAIDTVGYYASVCGEDDQDTPAKRAQAALREALAAPAGADVRRSDLVPGVMHCAKCKFQLNRVTLCVSDGNAYAGDNKTEPCPNGCGPLWPVTWEQEARNCWKTLEEMHERLQAAPAAGAVAGPGDYTPLLDDEGRMMVGTSHHYTAENIRALVAEYKALEAGGPDTWELHYNTDHRARAGVLWRVISALADEVPFAAAPMSPANRLVAYNAATRLRELGFEWDATAEAWLQPASKEKSNDR